MVQERQVRIERRLSAILAADVAGYSRLMHHDEEATHAKLTTLLTDTVCPCITEHGGRIVKNTGDGFLAEFPSAVEAVRAAVQFQTRIKELTISEVEDRGIALRVGINIGDVIVEPHDVFGDGVNIAARLESIAEPGGICISSSAYDHVRGKVGVEFADLGEQNLKNIARPVHAYAVVQEGSYSPSIPAERTGRSGPSPPRLSIVVLPFTNLSGDPEQDYFVDGVTESLTTDLSRISGSFVIGRHTAFTYKGKAVDLKKIGQELNVRYVLEGSVQQSLDQLRVNVQLVETENAGHLWAERFDKRIADLFEMQDEIVSRLANTLRTELIEAEARRSERSPHPDAMDLYFQGRHWWNKGLTSEYLAQARHFFERSLAIDPANADAMTWIALVDVARGVSFLTDDSPRYFAAETILLEVLSRTPNHAWAHFVLGALQIYTNRVAQGVAQCERALALDHNLADAHVAIGTAKFFTGCAVETDAHVNEALRLSPRDIFAFRWLLLVGFAKLQLAEDAEAVSWFLRSIEANRNFPLAHFACAAALALLGSSNEAVAAAKMGLTLNPSFTIRRFREGAQSNNATYLAKRERVYEGMRLAGIPER